MRAKPTTTYHLASPKTWELIRAAYLAGMSAPALSARFGVSVGAIRKRAGRDGWTKAAYAQSLDGQGGSPLAGAPSAAAEEVPPPGPWERLGEALPPFRVSPAGLARRALGDAARALGEGRLDDARRLVTTANAVVRLSETVDIADSWSDDPFEAEARQSLLRKAVFEMAIELSETLTAGRPLPDAYAGLYAELQTERARNADLSAEAGGPS